MSVINEFNAPIRYAVAYGSGAYSQRGYENAKDDTMVDFIFGVTHAEHWHSLNLRQNPSHYSSLRYLGVNSITSLQERVGGRIYYNPDVMVGDFRVKYGVVSMHHLIRDLDEWETFYLAGRLQKPVTILRDDAKSKLATEANLLNAVRVALLMLPENFEERDLYLKIAGLSYSGDFRMIIGENPHKVSNIVDAQFEEFKQKYSPILPLITSIELHQLGEGKIHVYLI
jgi:translocator assembly and maintenance protein 41